MVRVAHARRGATNCRSHFFAQARGGGGKQCGHVWSVWLVHLASVRVSLSPSLIMRAATPTPSAFATTLFDGLFRFANETTSREPLSDWTQTTSPAAVGFSNRPVRAAMSRGPFASLLLCFVSACVATPAQAAQ